MIKTTKRLEGRGNDLNTRGRKRDCAAARFSGKELFGRDNGEEMVITNSEPETSSGVTAAGTGGETRDNKKKPTAPVKILRVFKAVLRSADVRAYGRPAFGG